MDTTSRMGLGMVVVLISALGLVGLPDGVEARQDAAPTLHHAHLNAVDPVAAIAWYQSLWPAGRAGEVAGIPAFIAEMALLFTPVDTPPAGAWDSSLERSDPQSPFWHIGGFMNTTGVFEALEPRGVEVLRLSTGPDDRDGVIRSGLTPYAGIVDRDGVSAAPRAPAREGGFGYLVGPDGALVELTGGPSTEPAFAHVHLFHSRPRCAANWYVDVLGFDHSPTRDPTTGERRERARWEPCDADPGERGWPSLERAGTVRAPSATVIHGSGSISLYPRQCTGEECGAAPALVTSRGQVLDHVAFAVTDLTPWLARLEARNVTILEGPYPFGLGRAVLIAGPDGLAIELVDMGSDGAAATERERTSTPGG